MAARRRFISFALLPILGATVLPADAAEVAAPAVHPPAVELRGGDARHGLLVTSTDAAGRTRDVTAACRFRVADSEIARVDAGGTVSPVSDGRTEIIAEYGGRSAQVTVTIRETERSAAPSFLNEVIPLLTRSGCNRGACHGKQAGQNGFRLSLRGFAPNWDHAWLTREFQGRRISFVAPDDSLLLRKALGDVPHGGGRVLPAGSRPHRLLRRWVAGGAPGPVDGEPRLEAIEILPGDVMAQSGDEWQLLVRGRFSDGEVRDVTWLSQFFSGDESVLEVSADGRVRCLRAGEAVVRVHFQEQVEVVTFTIPHAAEIDVAAFPRATNAIDEHVFAKLNRLRIPPSPTCDDATFLRRASLDTIGTLPTADEARRFLDDDRPGKRSELVDELLERPEFVDYWTLQFADLLQNRKERDHDVRGTKGVRAFHAWLRHQVAANRPWNELAADVLTATGDSFTAPEVGYYVVTVGEARRAEESEVVASVAQSFLGTRIGCAECHNHPLEKYTQDDYYHFAAFFSRISFDRRKPDEGPTSLRIAGARKSQLHRRIDGLVRKIAQTEASPDELDEKAREQLERQRAQLAKTREELAAFEEGPVQVRQPRTGESLAPRPLDRVEVEVGAGDDPREALVGWMTDPGNENFSGSLVNRLWKHFLGVGLVEPVDDLRPSNPPSNRALWDHLNREFVSHGFDVKHVMRLILNSRTYQAASATLPGNANDRRFHSHYQARRLPAEVMLDAICRATGVPEQFPGYPLGMRAIQIPDPGAKSYFLEIFGRSERVTACACERDGEVTLPQLLHMQNGDWIARKLNASEGRLARLLREEPGIADEATVEELFLATLSRRPDGVERETVLGLLSTADDRTTGLRDVLWALINTKEFAFNH